MIYVLGYYEEKSSKAREKKAEMVAHMAAKAAVVATPPGPVVLEKETMEIGGVLTPVRWNLMQQLWRTRFTLRMNCRWVTVLN